jgi:hypothetical protein
MRCWSQACWSQVLAASVVVSAIDQDVMAFIDDLRRDREWRAIADCTR